MTPARATAGKISTTRPMVRFDLTKRLVARLKNEEAVIGGIGFTNFDLWASGRRPQNFYMLGSMGLALPIAFGVALARPRQRVVGIEGDGSLLMQVGALATIASVQPKNLLMIVMDNRAYQITGGQPTATAFNTDLVVMARGAGIEASDWARDAEDFERLVDEGLARAAPTLIAARIDDSLPAATTHRDPVQIREAFMRGLGVRPAL
jgi:thiamine pyrophosphate-dependent acetolactate synthase large subunit-like protein